ncbi:MAG: tryptophan 2,3-dioxygenase [Actinobacteria bacterium]|nr:tryptophan 2,3-dioxygenase [Actinomycetota bacterium]
MTDDATAGGDAPLYYADYLHLDDVLGAQRLESAKAGTTAHDEMLFIIVHQAYELWFKQILWELDAVLQMMGQDEVAERDVGRTVSHLRRIIEIQRLLIDQISVLETMTPLDFLDFRDMLIPASGFQSVQFRLIENRLGLDPAYRLKIDGAPYHSRLTSVHAQQLLDSEEEPALIDHVERWLERTPFLSWEGFDFWTAYRGAVEEMIGRDRRLIETNPNLDEGTRQAQLERFEETVAHYEALFDDERYDALMARGYRHLSRMAFLAALEITLYRDEPIMQLPFRLLEALMDVDEGFTTWRYRHALMAQRMIGGRIGTGGTSGAAYLRKAAERHRVFRDLFDLATFLIPRSHLPELPEDMRQAMQFRWSGG